MIWVKLLFYYSNEDLFSKYIQLCSCDISLIIIILGFKYPVSKYAIWAKKRTSSLCEFYSFGNVADDYAHSDKV